MIKIAPDILKIIQESKIDGNKLYLSKQLDRNVYVVTNKILESIGLKWNRSAKCHVSEHDVEELIESILNSGEWVDEKKLNQFYETPAAIVTTLINSATFGRDSQIRILEPSAGNGAILSQLINRFPNAVIDFCEINKSRAETCIELGAIQIGEDFLAAPTPIASKYDLIVMNPPFSKQQDIEHVLHAFNHFLKDGGEIISVMSEGTFFRKNKKTDNFWKTVRENSTLSEITNLPDEAFKSSGTLVRTRLLMLRKG